MNSNAPEKKFRRGSIVASVWVNETRERKQFKTIGVERRYKAQDGTWKSATRFSASDVPRLLLVLAQAYNYVSGGEASLEEGAVEEEEEEASALPPTSHIACAPSPSPSPSPHRCQRCNRPITAPESVRTGFGPQCRAAVAAREEKLRHDALSETYERRTSAT